MATKPEVVPRNQEARARWGCVALLFAWLCVLGVGAALAARGATEWYAPLVVGSVVLFLSAKAAADALRRWASAPLLPVATSAGIVCVAIALCAVAPDAVGERIRELREAWPQGAAAGSRGAAPWAGAFVASVVLAPIVGAGLGMVLTRALRRATLARTLRAAALGATALCAVLALLAVTRGLRRPSIDDELSRLRETTEKLAAPGIPGEVDVRDSRGRPVSTRAVVQAGPAGVRRTSLRELTVVQVCEPAGCRIGVKDGLDAPASAEDAGEPATYQKWDETLLFTRDLDTDTLYVHPEHGRVRAELHHVDGRWVATGFSPRDIARRSAPPRSWLVAALLGLAVAALMSWRRRAAKKRADALATAGAGVLDEDGWIRLGDGESARLEGPKKSLPGPVVVLASRSANSAYRDRPLSVSEVLPGTLEEHRERASLDVLVRDAAILAAAAISSALLVAAVLAGLVLPIGGGEREPLASLSEVRPPPAPDGPPEPTAGLGWRFRAIDVLDLNRDDIDDVVGDCQLPHSNVSGPVLEHLACAVDGKTMRRMWLGPSSGIGAEGALARAGDLVLATAYGGRGRALDVRTGKEVRSFPLPERGREPCVLTADGASVWLGSSTTDGATLDLRTGVTTRGPKPASCWARWTSVCEGGLEGLCGSAPTVAETATLDRATLTAVAVFRTDRAVLVVANKLPNLAARSEGPAVAALDPKTSALLWQFDVALTGGPGEANGAATVRDGVLFVSYATKDAHVAAFDAATGRPLWDFKVKSYSSRAPWSFLVSNHRVYVPSGSGLSVLDARTGAELGTIDGS